MQVPTEALLPEAVQQVAAGDAHTLCLSTSGRVWASGSDSHGQLGLGGGAPFVGRLRLLKALEGAQKLRAGGAVEACEPIACSSLYSGWVYRARRMPVCPSCHLQHL